MNLSKGSSIDLSKATTETVFKVGASWGKIKSKGLFGFGGQGKSVDLDLCTFALSGNKVISECSFRSQHVTGMSSSGDDQSGGAKGADNETITLTMGAQPPHVDSIAVVINSYTGESFDELPFAKVRVYDKNKELCSFSMSNDEGFRGAKTLIVGVFIKAGSGWEFQAIGETRTYNSITAFRNEVEGK